MRRDVLLERLELWLHRDHEGHQHGATARNGWTLTFTLPAGQQVTNGWSGTFSQSGTAVTVTNVPWNAALAAGASVEIGFNATGTGQPLGLRTRRAGLRERLTGRVGCSGGNPERPARPRSLEEPCTTHHAPPPRAPRRPSSPSPSPGCWPPLSRGGRDLRAARRRRGRSGPHDRRRARTEPALGAAYAAVADREFNLVVAENAMKWDATEPQPGTFTWAGADEVAAYAEAQGAELYGHTLVWHSQLPTWVSDLGTATELRAAMTNHISQVAGATPIASTPGTSSTRRSRTTGPGARASSSRSWATGTSRRRSGRPVAAPDADLCINDYSTDAINAKSTAIYELVKDFIARGCRSTASVSRRT
ncbi:endo-1,4-beta-xylanase [Oerskovia sp. M15]